MLSLPGAPGSIPGQGTKIPQATQHGKERKRERERGRREEGRKEEKEGRKEGRGIRGQNGETRSTS